jgi:hypothetical protein
MEELYGAPPSEEQQPVSGFVLCPAILLEHGIGTSMQQQVYQWAFQRAVAAVRPSGLERAFGYNRN